MWSAGWSMRKPSWTNQSSAVTSNTVFLRWAFGFSGSGFSWGVYTPHECIWVPFPAWGLSLQLPADSGRLCWGFYSTCQPLGDTGWVSSSCLRAHRSSLSVCLFSHSASQIKETTKTWNKHMIFLELFNQRGAPRHPYVLQGSFSQLLHFLFGK